jgi:NADH-quinone oxidoreductase subunit B
MTDHGKPLGPDPLRILGAPTPPPAAVDDEALREELGRSVFFAKADSVIGWAVNQSRANSIWPLGSGLACCAIEMMCTLGPGFDISRMGAEVMRPSPRQADLIFVAGRVSLKMAPVLRQLWDQMPDPKWAIAMGACASSGGIFNNYAILQGVDKILPVDVYVPGCPPRPESLIYGVIKLQEKILASGVELGPLAPRRKKKGGA